MSNVYLIDSSIYIFRYYFSNRPSVISQSGHEVSTVLAFSRWLLQFLEKEKPDQLACFFDESLESCFRNEIDGNYKANRSLPDEALAYELLACKKVCELFGLSVYASERYEADDLIAAASKKAWNEGNEHYVITRDKDLGQLLKKDQGFFWDYGYGDTIAYDSFAREFGIQPVHIPDYLAIAGDTADSIAGVKGVGKKTVAALFEHFDGWADLKENINRIPDLPIRGAKGIAKKIAEGIELVEHNLQLTRLAFDSIQAEELCFSRTAIDGELIKTLFVEFNAPKSLLTKIEKFIQEHEIN